MVINDGIIYYGRMTASMSHEINNVLAIVNELAGLQDDLLYAIEDSSDIDPQRFGKAAQDIQKQVQRGKSIVNRLNRLAHSIDEPISAFDLIAVIRDTVEIAQRLAVIHSVKLNYNPENTPININSNRFIVQQGLFACLEMAYSSLDAGSEVEIECGINDKIIEIRVYSESSIKVEDQGDRLVVLSRLMDIIKGKIEQVLLGGNRSSLVLSFPRFMTALAE
jgi:signal transduction histidine kinase